MNEWMNEWMRRWVSEWINGWMNKCECKKLVTKWVGEIPNE